jgi:hypothetical protein
MAGFNRRFLIDNVTHQVGECDSCLKMIYLIRFLVLKVLKSHKYFSGYHTVQSSRCVPLYLGTILPTYFTLKIVSVYFFEMLVYICQSTRFQNPETTTQFILMGWYKLTNYNVCYIKCVKASLQMPQASSKKTSNTRGVQVLRSPIFFLRTRSR